MSEQAAAPKVHSEHPQAHEGIEALRTVAASLRDIGNELVESRERNADYEGEVGKLTEALAEAEYQAEQGAEALSAVDDYRLGLCDRDELLQRVCGRT